MPTFKNISNKKLIFRNGKHGPVFIPSGETFKASHEDVSEWKNKKLIQEVVEPVAEKKDKAQA